MMPPLGTLLGSPDKRSTQTSRTCDPAPPRQVHTDEKGERVLTETPQDSRTTHKLVPARTALLLLSTAASLFSLVLPPPGPFILV